MRLTVEVERAMRAHAEATAPAECVGALLGARHEVTVALPLRNSAAHRERGFELTAREYLLAEQEAEQRGLRLLGFFHSHVDVPAVPSALDRRQAAHFLGGVIVPVEHGVAGRPVVFHSRG